jgi:hypothetical protein
MACATVTDCPTPPNGCVLRLCNGGVCSTKNVASDTPTATQTAGDCKQDTCDGAGSVVTVDDDSDVPSDNEVCTVDTCSGSMPVHAPAAAGFNCLMEGPAPAHLCGAPTGIKAGKCVECNVTADCTSGKTCVGNACQ